MTTPRASYLICTTPYSGSRSLCEVLRSTALAGRPDTHFSRYDEPFWARRWEVVDDADYVRATITQATTRNGLLGTEIQWDDLHRLHRKLRTFPGHDELPAPALGSATFPGLLHIFLTVGEKLARAVSAVMERQRERSDELEFDIAQIGHCLREIEEGEAGWRHYFHTHGIQPLVVEFEAFVASPQETLCRIADFLGIDIGAGRDLPELAEREQDDVLRDEWIDRFRARALPRRPATAGRRHLSCGKASRTPRVHLAAVVGGGDSILLPHLVEHYRGLGVESFYVTRHAESTSDPTYEEIEHHARAVGVKLFQTHVGPWDIDLKGRLMSAAMGENPDDWYVLVDLDEFHLYDRPLEDLIELCRHNGCSHVCGCFVDRVAADGGFPDVGSGSLWERFPLGGAVTSRLVSAPPLKIGLAMGRLQVGGGHHGVPGSTGLPREHSYVQVHHFKWTRTVVERTRRLVQRYESGAWRLVYPDALIQARRFLDYVDHHGERIDITDARFFLSSAGDRYGDYARWNDVVGEAQSWQWIFSPD